MTGQEDSEDMKDINRNNECAKEIGKFKRFKTEIYQKALEKT